MKKVREFLKGLFTKNVPIKLLAILLAVITVILINV